MEAFSSKTFKQELSDSLDSSKILEYLSLLDEQLKYIHSCGYYIDNINFDTIIINGYQDLGFIGIFPVNNLESSQNIYNNNIKQLAEVSLGAFVYLSSARLGNIQDPSYFDYSKITANKDPEFISKNYPIIRQAIPYEPGYYDNVIIRKQYDYFGDYLNKNEENNNTMNKSPKLVKATAAGRVYSGEEAAFVKVGLNLIIIGCIAIMFFIIYMIYLYI